MFFRHRLASRVRECSIAMVIAFVLLQGARRAEAQCTFEWKPGDDLPGVDGDVNATVVYDDGSGPALYVGGSFTIAGDVWASNIAKWNGTSWSALGSGTNGDVFALTVYNGNLIAGGGFSTAGGVTVNCIAQWN